MEITMQGVFYGLGRTVPPAIVSIGCNYMRIPVALLLVHMGMGVDAIWWAVKWNDRCQRSYTDSLVRPHQKENSLKRTELANFRKKNMVIIYINLQH